MLRYEINPKYNSLTHQTHILMFLWLSSAGEILAGCLSRRISEWLQSRCSSELQSSHASAEEDPISKLPYDTVTGYWLSVPCQGPLLRLLTTCRLFLLEWGIWQSVRKCPRERHWAFYKLITSAVFYSLEIIKCIHS